METPIQPVEFEKQRRDYGIQTNFGDTALADSDVSIDSDPRFTGNWFSLIEKTQELDCIPKMARHMVSTRTHKTGSKGSSHQDGALHAGDKKMNEIERDKNRKTIIRKDENYVNGVKVLVDRGTKSIQQNQVIDMYEKYFDEEEKGVHATEAPSTKTSAVFRDPARDGSNPDARREANYVSWHPESTHIAVAYSCLNFQRTPSDMKETSYIWDLNNPNVPYQALTPNSPLTSLEYNPRSADMICGGSYNGLVSFWDVRAKTGNPDIVIDKAHHDPVYDVRWVQSSRSNECVTVSTDGRMLWWDLRYIKDVYVKDASKRSMGYIDSLLLKTTDDKESKTTYGGMSLAYNTGAGPTKYLVGTEQGYVMLVDRKAKKEGESAKTVKLYGKPGAKHHGPIYAIERNPISTKNFLSIGDWTARVWVEDSSSPRTPIMMTRYDKAWLTGGCWSPGRPGVFFTTKDDGTFDAWDIYYKQNEPTYSTKVSDAPLCTIKPAPTAAALVRGHLVAIGSKDGTTTVLQLSSGLCEEAKDEKKQMLALFERECKREKNLEMSAQVRKREESKRAKNHPAPFDPNAEEPEPIRLKLEEVEKRFFQTLKMNPDGTPIVREAAVAEDHPTSA